MSINYRALERVESRMTRSWNHPDRRDWGYEQKYIQGETFFVDAALDTRGYALDLYAMVIGEAPGATEHLRGRPFVGRAGIVLRQLLEDVSLPPAWITNVVKFRPHRNHTPTEEQIETAKPFLRDEWVAIGKPRTVICCGNTALKAVTGRAGVLQRAGKMEVWPASDDAPVYLWPMVHPSYGVRNPEKQPALNKHWRCLSDWLDVTYGKG